MPVIILLCDGMSDYPVNALKGKTPMQAAYKPNMDRLAAFSELGLCKTVPDGLSPGSDVANLSVLGYDPVSAYSGRSPYEAASIGVDMKPTDVSLRCNFVTLSEDGIFSDKTMIDYCADDIGTDEAVSLIKSLNEKLGTPVFTFYSGVSYRNLLLWENGVTGLDCTPPHDITGKPVAPYIVKNSLNAPIYDLMEQALPILAEHPVNKERIKAGKRPANAIWLWGEGKKKELTLFSRKYNIQGAMISAVDLLKGIAKTVGMDVINVEGATGYLDTNFAGKAKAAIDALKGGADFVYLHIEAPDECGHRGEIENKVRAIELIDRLVLSPILDAFGDKLRLLIMPDHATPLSLGTHTRDPVPYLLYKGGAGKYSSFTEETAAASGIFVPRGEMMIDKLIGADIAGREPKNHYAGKKDTLTQ